MHRELAITSLDLVWSCAGIAGCKTVVLATPPRSDGSISPEVLYCARKAGVTHVLLAGGAQAVAAMAWGTASCPKVGGAPTAQPPLHAACWETALPDELGCSVHALARHAVRVVPRCLLPSPASAPWQHL